jgi:hypothetical protein
MKREILIINKRTKQVHNGLIKICKDRGDKKGIYLFSDLFNGQECIPSEKEKFKYSWVLIYGDEKELNFIKNIKEIKQEYFRYNLPCKSVYSFVFKNKTNFKDIEL